MNRSNHLRVLAASAALPEARAERDKAKFEAGSVLGVDDMDVRSKVRT